MRSLRPTSLSKIVRVLTTLNALNTPSLTELSSALGMSLGHTRELIKMLQALRLVSLEGEALMLTQEGREFLVSYASRNANHIDAVLSMIESYKKARECLESGLSKPSDIAKCAGLNTVTVDITLRLIREVRALQELNNLLEPNSMGIEAFEQMLYELYKDLAVRRKNKYVPIHDLMNSMTRKSRLNPKTFTSLLAKLVEKQRGRVMLISSPSLVDHPFVEINGKRYTYLIFLER